MGQDATPSPSAPVVEGLVVLARREPVAVWEERFGRAVLVGPDPDGDRDGEADDEDDPWAFQTMSASLDSQAGDPLTSFRDSEVYGLKKATRGAFAATVLVGRASSNDVTIPHPSLSKLHARIYLAGDGTMTISDSGSKNGSMLNGTPLGETPVPLGHGDMLQLGRRNFKVYATRHFHRLVGRLLI
ncbi:MAG: FHA domain-containing protein [Gemmatimonadetes bacterium]|nr:FHA domain-containing protein [Gemmatimonadota bacterium]